MDLVVMVTSPSFSWENTFRQKKLDFIFQFSDFVW